MLRRRIVLPEHDQIDVPNQSLQYRICASDKRRTVALKVDRNGTVSIYVPDVVPLSIIRQLVIERQSWILAKQAMVAARSTAVQPLQTGTRLDYLGESLTLAVENGRPARCRRDGPVLIATASDRSSVKQVLESWYRNEAKTYFPGRIAVLAAQVGRAPKQLAIRGQRSRWGSCTRAGIISLNWRLMQCPADIIDYVVVHELCHLLVPDHSPKFWTEVARVLPGWREHRRALRVAGETMPL